MDSPDVKNALTPISVHGVANQGSRAFWKRQLGRSTSTPLCGTDSLMFPSDPRHRQPSAGSPQLSESPIFSANSKVNLASVLMFGRRKLSLEGEYLSTNGITSAFGNMVIAEKSKEDAGESSSNSRTDEVKRQIIKVKKRKSPIVYKIKKAHDAGGKRTGISSTLKTSAADTKKRVLKKSSPRSGSQVPVLKISYKHPRSPKLQTAIRAKTKKEKEEIRKQQEKEQEEYKKKLLEEEKRKEEAEILKLRQETVFKASVVRKYAPLPVAKKRALTVPTSPRLSKRRRIEPSQQIIQ